MKKNKAKKEEDVEKIFQDLIMKKTRGKRAATTTQERQENFSDKSIQEGSRKNEPDGGKIEENIDKENVAETPLQSENQNQVESEGSQQAEDKVEILAQEKNSNQESLNGELQKEENPEEISNTPVNIDDELQTKEEKLPQENSQNTISIQEMMEEEKDKIIDSAPKQTLSRIDQILQEYYARVGKIDKEAKEGNLDKSQNILQEEIAKEVKDEGLKVTGPGVELAQKIDDEKLNVQDTQTFQNIDTQNINNINNLENGEKKVSSASGAGDVESEFKNSDEKIRKINEAEGFINKAEEDLNEEELDPAISSGLNRLKEILKKDKESLKNDAETKKENLENTIEMPKVQNISNDLQKTQRLDILKREIIEKHGLNINVNDNILNNINDTNSKNTSAGLNTSNISKAPTDLINANNSNNANNANNTNNVNTLNSSAIRKVDEQNEANENTIKTNEVTVTESIPKDIEAIKQALDSFDTDEKKLMYLEKVHDNYIKLKCLSKFKDEESRAKLISFLNKKIAPELYRSASLAQKMIMEFIDDIYKNHIFSEKKELLEIVFNETNMDFKNLSNDEFVKVDYENHSIFLSEKRKFQPSKILGDIILGYTYLLCERNIYDLTNEKKLNPNIDVKAKLNQTKFNEIIEKGNAELFTDIVINEYIEKHPHENLGFQIETPYSYDGNNLLESSIARTVIYPLDKLKIDKKMLLEYIIGNKNKYLRAILGKEKFDLVKQGKEVPFNLRDFYEKNKFAFDVIEDGSIYYSKNYILPLYVLQNRLKTKNILDTTNNSIDVLKDYFHDEKINKINPALLSEVVDLIREINKVNPQIFTSLNGYIKEELARLTDMEKRTASAQILENILIFMKYHYIEDEEVEDIIKIIQYLINDIERSLIPRNGKKIIQRIDELPENLGIKDVSLDDELKDYISRVKVKLALNGEENVTSNTFFNRLRASLVNASKIERNEEIAGYQTIKDELAEEEKIKEQKRKEEEKKARLEVEKAIMQKKNEENAKRKAETNG